MVSIGTLEIAIKADMSDYNRARKTLEQDQGLKFHIVPTVDHKNLTALNRHFSEKEDHHKKVQKGFDQNPLTPKVDLRELNSLTKAYQDLSRLKDNLVSGSGTIHFAVEHTYKVDIHHTVKNQKSQNESNEYLKRIEKNTQKGGLMSLVTAPIRGVATGLIEGTGIAAAKSMFNGLNKDVITSFETLGNRMFEYASKRGKDIGEAVSKNMGYGDGLKDVKKDLSDIGQRIDNVLDPEKFGESAKKFEDSIVAGFERLNKDDMSGFKKNIKEAFDTAIEVLKEIGLRAGGVGLRVSAQPFRIRQRVKLDESADQAKEMAKNIIVDKNASQDKQSIAIITGGIDFQKGGKNTDFAANVIGGLFPDAHIQKVYNADANEHPNNPLSNLQKKRKGDKYKPSPADKLLQNVVIDGGFKDAVEMAAHAYAYRQQFPDKPINLFGT